MVLLCQHAALKNNIIGEQVLKYIVKKIQEADYGCEERLVGYVIQDLQLLRDEAGHEIDMEVPDADLYAKDINEGDWGYFG